MVSPSSSPTGLPAEALADLPVFPLPGVVFFPGALLPLHIFEPRYRAMARHCLAGHRAMAVTMLVAGEPDADGQPPFATVAGAGVIIEHEELSDGRFNLLLRGEARVSLVELPFVAPFRRTRAILVPDTDDAVTPADAAAVRALAVAFAGDVKAQNASFDFQLPLTLSPVLVVDLVASSLVVEPEVRQHILETRSAAGRCERVLEALSQQRAQMGRRTPRPGHELNLERFGERFERKGDGARGARAPQPPASGG